MSVTQERGTTEPGGAFAGYLKRRVLPTNSADRQSLSVTLYRLLGRGAPVAHELLADACDLPTARVEALLREFPSTVVLDDQGAVIAFGGLSLAPTHHRLIADETTLYTWCAFDALFLPEILRKQATLTTRCPGSGAKLAVELASGEVLAAPPSGCVMSVVTPGTEACCDNLRKAFCDHVSLFKDEQTFRAWSKDRRGIGCVTLQEAQLFARRRNALQYPDLDLSA